MSVVAYKDGVLAADSRAYGGSWQASPGQKAKIHQLADGTRVGITSSVIGMPDRVLAWLRGGGVPSDFGAGDMDCRVLMVKPNGDVYLGSGSPYLTGPIRCASYAIGSGCDFAMGAMAAGATAEEAVRIACRLDPNCGEPVMVL